MRRRTKPSEKKEKKIDWPRLLVGGSELVVGSICAITGQAGYRAAFSSGVHIHIAGGILALLGVWMLLGLRKKEEPSHTTEPTPTSVTAHPAKEPRQP
jgi:uncharacterized membrane protein YfcA